MKFNHLFLSMIVLSTSGAFATDYDFNGDGKADILWKKDKYYSLWYMNADGSHKYKYIGKKYSPYEVVGIGDFNNDGKDDILWKKDKYYSFWYMSADGSHKYKYIGKKDSPYEVVGVGDFNNDGKYDILWKKDKYYSFWYMNADGSHKYKYIGKKDSPYKVVGIGDFNNDGRADILWKKDKYYSFWYMNSDGSHKYKYIGKKYSPYEVVGVGDFNNDGKDDILWKKDKYYSFWYMNSDGSHKYKYIGRKDAPYEVVEVGDFNNDGKDDILWRKDKYYSFWYMNSDGSHKYKYIGKKYSPYEVVSSSTIFNGLKPILSKLFLNGKENTKFINKTINMGSIIEEIEIDFQPSQDILAGTTFSLFFKNGGFDISTYYPVLCVGTEKVGSIMSYGNNYNSNDNIVYEPTFSLNDYSDVSKDSLITFKKEDCSNDVQPIKTMSETDTTIQVKIINGMTSQGLPIEEYNTNSVEIKVQIEEQNTNTPPIVAIEANKTTIEVGETITLNANATDNDGTIASYEWKDQDGNILGTESTLDYSSNEAGTYDLSVTVTDDDGENSSNSVKITVTAEQDEETSDTDNPFNDIKK